MLKRFCSMAKITYTAILDSNLSWDITYHPCPGEKNLVIRDGAIVSKNVIPRGEGVLPPLARWSTRLTHIPCK